MSNQITTANVLQFGTNVALLSQQVGSRLRSCVTTGSHTGKAAAVVEQFGSVEPVELNVRHADTPVIETPEARRWVSPKNFGGGDMFDEEDAVRILIDPKNVYARAQAAGMGRAIDRALIAAAKGTSKVGEDGTTNEAFDTANYQIAAGGTGLTIQKLVQAREKMMAANVNPDDEFYVIVAQKHITDLLSAGVVNNYVTPIVTSNDFFPQGQMSPLMSAQIPLIAGFRLIQTQLTLNTECIAFAKSGLYLGVWADIQSYVNQIPSKSMNWLIQTKATFGATRLEQGKVVSILTT